jgi:hypothetical protein
MEELDKAVRLALHEILAGRPDVVADLVEERDQRLRAEQAGQGDRREAALAEAAELERQIGNLVNALASGVAAADVTAGIAERRAKVEVLRATPAPPPQFDRAAFFKRFEGVRKISMLLEKSYPQQTRSVLRKLGVDRIVVTRGADGKSWDFEGVADVGCLLTTGSPRTTLTRYPLRRLVRGHGLSFSSSLRAEDMGTRGMPPSPPAAARLRIAETLRKSRW